MDQQQPPPPPPVMNQPENQPPPPPPPPPPQKCPRCDSANTKFCYYNNYSLAQPRYFCKACRRYWTHGGTLRNVPGGGGRRKNNKRPKNAGNRGFAPVRQNFAAGQPSRPFPQVVPPAGGPFFAGINQGAAATANYGGGSNQFGGNMTMLQGMNLPPVKPQAATVHQFQPPANFMPQNQNLIPQRNLSFWNQSLINTGGASSSYSAAHGGDLAASSIGRNQMSDNYRGFNMYNPSQ